MDTPGFSTDAAIVLGLAGTAMPFASSSQAEAERWLRVMRTHGQVGVALQALGVGEAPLETDADPRGLVRHEERARTGEDPVALVASHAAQFASRRGSGKVTTVDILFAVLRVYGPDFDRALYVRGASREELLERLYGGALVGSAD